MEISNTPAPPGAAWVGEWDPDFGDRVFGTDPVTVANVDIMVTGIQNLDGSTVSGVALRVQGVVIGDGRIAAVTAELTPFQAHELAAAVTDLANRAVELDHQR